jgi:signal transduction histidine kinase
MHLIDFLFGMIAMQAIFFLYFFLIFKKKEFLYFLLFVLCVLSFVFILIQPRGNFLGFEIQFERLLPLPFGILFFSLAFYYRFARYFIDAPIKYQLLNKVIRWAEWYTFLLGFLFLIKFFLVPDLPYIVIVGQATFFINIFIQIFLFYSIYKIKTVSSYLLLYGSLFMILIFRLTITPVVLNPTDFMSYSETPRGMLLGLVGNFLFFNFIMIYNHRKSEQDQVKLEFKRKEELELQRREISNDLHDEMGSTLSGLQVYAGIAANELKSGGDKTLFYLEKITAGVRMAMNNLGDVIWAVRNDQHADKTISSRLKNFFMDVFDASNIDCIYEIDPDAESMIEGVVSRKYLMLVAKEAINNIVKHGRASQITFQLGCVGDDLRLCIEDNGVGFDVDRQSAGTGFFSIKDRIAKLGGRLQIISQLGKGTRIECLVPITIIREK